uniref:NADH-ubiquinone oxidoreductase chain 2 n=1 Tax=Yuukianura szeptyckii TaxID=1453868 RepID=A0A7T0Q5B4_9HEXA|nr:NADH dehydrogenase subunit 2 [Yuukianura szeptyckii]QPL15820.1 NADH dehydrogenase subunit 2 [Yuukianura szeptyckii]
MFFKSKILIFLPTLIFGSILTVSSSSWFSAWIGLEINLMSMAPILLNKSTPKSTEATIKYFIFQALASSMLIFFILSSSVMFFYSLGNYLLYIITASLTLKIGMAPFHFWFPQVMMCSNWPQCFILLTWQKLAPFILLSFCFCNFFNLIIFLSALIGMLGGINQFNTKILLAYSSIIHSSWMLSLIVTNNLFWGFYLLAYTLITLSILYPLSSFSSSFFNNFLLMKFSSFSKSLFFINFLSIAGLPPFLGFSIKIFTLISLFNSNFSIFLILVLLLSSFVSFYFYLRMMFSSLFNFSWINNFIWYNSNSFKLEIWFIFISFFINSFIPLVIILT